MVAANQSALYQALMRAGGEASRRAIEEAQIKREGNDLRAFMRRVNPKLEYPEHLGPYLDVLTEVGKGAVIECVVSTPPRHTKTTTTLHKLVQLFRVRPNIKIAYITYGAELSESKSYEARLLAERAGIKLDPAKCSLSEWRTVEGGVFVATGIGGPLTGRGFDLIVIDDPHKDRAEAESRLIRDRTWDWFTAVAYTRQEPGGTSFVVIQTRWHPDDLAGRLIKRGWRCINLEAISSATGQALWPSFWPVEQLRKIEEQIGPYDWSALYQGQPRSRGSTVFNDAHYYTALPTQGYSVSIGGDFAYTSKTYSDFNVAVVLYHCGGISYVADAVRERCDVAQFKPLVLALQAKHGGMVSTYVAATEMGVVEFFRSNHNGTEGSLRVNAMRATVDKFTRAQPVSAAWNAGKVLVPKTAPWLPAFLDEVTGFTGVKDPHDDQVDALAGAFAPYAVTPRQVYRNFGHLPPQ